MADRQLGALITHTAASAGVTGGDQDGSQHKGILVFINITAISGTSPTLTVTLEGKDEVSGQHYTILASAALNATGFTVLRVFPGLTASANLTASDVLPTNWRVKSVIGGTGPSVTATISAALIA
jgi:hypothetical protein